MTAQISGPLYAQVRETLVARMAAGELKPGQLLPSEFALAAELSVSQGTVRKALDTLEADNLITRKQGRGTFVAEHTPERALFQFFRMEDVDGNTALPRTLSEEISHRKAPKRIAARLGVSADAVVVRVRRTRALLGRPASFEDVFVPHALMPIPEDAILPNALYNHYQAKFGLSIARAEDHLSACLAPDRVAKALPAAAGKAVLMQTRAAYDLTGRLVEVRESFYLTEGVAYAVDLR
ncbi:MAG: GntR family transcriptional regulator [Pseudomonadota bacterium]